MEPRVYTLITGASSGIGKSIALILSQNRHLVLHGRDLNRLNETRNLCANHGRHLLWSVDLAEPGQIQPALSELLLKQQAAIDCFVHCAGVLKTLPMRQMELTLAREIMNVNFHSAAEIIRLLLKKTVNH